MPVYNILAIILVLCALFAYVNKILLKLPTTIGIMLLSLISSLIVIQAGKMYPQVYSGAAALVGNIDFYNVVIRVMLGYLLFAGSMQINAANLKKEALPVIVFSTVGLLLSTLIVGVLFYLAAGLLGIQLSFTACLLFGSLISPTDPIAVLGILRKANIPSSLETKICGESLFNDGVAIVVFITIYDVMQTGSTNLNFAHITLLFLQEAVGGLLFGAALGYAGYLILRTIDDYIVEALITLALVAGGYLLADVLHISGPLAVIIAGIITGNKTQNSISQTSRNYIAHLWEIIDEILNAVLFLLVGLQMVVIPFTHNLFWLGSITIAIVLFARYISIWLPSKTLMFKKTFEKGAVTILTWGGLRGGLSIALALSLPETMGGNVFVPVTYIVVLFSIVAQGLTIGKVAKKVA